MMQMKLDQRLNLVSVEKWWHFCTPFSVGDALKSDFRDGQTQRLVPILGATGSHARWARLRRLWRKTCVLIGKNAAKGVAHLGQNISPDTASPSQTKSSVKT